MQFRDLQKQYDILKDEIDAIIQNVCSSARFISGPEVSDLEKDLAEFTGVKHCITCANGTDAITLAMKAWGIGKKDAVFVPDFTYFASGESPAGEGATCIFVDVDRRTFNINPEELEKAVIKVKSQGKYQPKAVVAVDLFGQPADYDLIKPICRKYNLLLLEDGAQGFGGEIRGRKACSFGDISTTSFFPAKPLGCYGDGGAVFTDNDDWAALIRSYAVHGKSGNDKYNNARLGLNSRLDTIQAAILRIKLKAFKNYELRDVNKAAKMYAAEFHNVGLSDKLLLPSVKEGFLSSWAQYTIQLSEGIERDQVQSALKEAGIPTMIYYKRPMHMQKAFEGTESGKADCPVTEKLCEKVLSLPLHPYMAESQVKMVVSKISEIIK